MKIGIIVLNPNLIECDDESGVVTFIKTKLYEIGENISLISYFDNNLEKLRNIINDNYDMLFIVGSNSTIYNNNIKENLVRIFGDKLCSFEASYSSLQKYCKTNNIVFSIQEEMEISLPSKCIPLVSDVHYSNGFMYKHNNSYIMYLPPNLDFVEENYYNYILPLIKDLVSINNDYQVLRCFGLLERDIRALLNEFYGNKDLNINIISNGLDNAIFIRYSDNIDKSILQNTMSDICEKLSKFIYATEDVSLAQMAVDLLNLRHKKIAVVETLTLGNITRNLASIDCDVIGESHLFTNYSEMLKKFPISKNIIEDYGEYSVNSIYELANKTLEGTSSDIVVFILGDPKNREQNYMAIGDINGIHVYKNRSINNNKLIENLSNTAIFYLIKNLKQNDLQFR